MTVVHSSSLVDPHSNSVHAFSDAERNAFVRHINQQLMVDQDLAAVLPIDPMANDIFQVVRDGVLLWYACMERTLRETMDLFMSFAPLLLLLYYARPLLPLVLYSRSFSIPTPPVLPLLREITTDQPTPNPPSPTHSKLINAAVPDTIEPRAINSHFDRNQIKSSKTFLVLENHRHCLAGAKKIGCNIVNISGEDLVEGKPYLVFGLLWQIIRAGLLYHINLREHPELMQLFAKGEVRMVKGWEGVVADSFPLVLIPSCLLLLLLFTLSLNSLEIIGMTVSGYAKCSCRGIAPPMDELALETCWIPRNRAKLPERSGRLLGLFALVACPEPICRSVVHNECGVGIARFAGSC